MTRVCLVGSPDVNLQYELLSRETSREALSTYDLERPFANSIAVRTVSVGAAVSLCNDLQWYIVRFVDEVLVQEPSISESEWLSRELAEAIRNDAVDPATTGEYLKIFGLESTVELEGDRPGSGGRSSGPDDVSADDGVGGTESGDGRTEGGVAPAADESTESPPAASGARTASPPKLVEPLYVRRDGADPGASGPSVRIDGPDAESGAGDDIEPDQGGSGVPEYDLRDVEETLVVRLTEAEFTP